MQRTIWLQRSKKVGVDCCSSLYLELQCRIWAQFFKLQEKKFCLVKYTKRFIERCQMKCHLWLFHLENLQIYDDNYFDVHTNCCNFYNNTQVFQYSKSNCPFLEGVGGGQGMFLIVSLMALVSIPLQNRAFVPPTTKYGICQNLPPYLGLGPTKK